jgi:hypothetical protein
MGMVAGETELADLRVAFDRRLKLEFHGSKVTSDAGLIAFRELDDALGLTEMTGQVLADSRTGKNGRHTLIAQFRQSVFGRLAGYEDVNDADRLGHDPAMRWIVGGRATGEVRPPRCEMSWNRAAGDHQGGRGGDHAAMAASITPFRIPVGLEFGYSGVNQGRVGRPYRKCRFKGYALRETR